jgi:3-oxoacyl-[acyl-carrier protein] reductase
VDLGIAGKVALVTGASAGLGEAVAVALAKERCRISLSARRLPELERVAHRCREAGSPDTCALPSDQTNVASLESLVRETETRLGPVEIVALTSLTVKQPLQQLVLSNSFRTALVAALKTLSGEVAGEGITVNSIATGLVETERFRKLYATPEKRDEAVSKIPIGRAATPEEFAPLVAFLCGDGARYVTGQTISIDGGLVAGLFG